MRILRQKFEQVANIQKLDKCATPQPKEEKNYSETLWNDSLITIQDDDQKDSRAFWIWTHGDMYSGNRYNIGVK